MRKRGRGWVGLVFWLAVVMVVGIASAACAQDKAQPVQGIEKVAASTEVAGDMDSPEESEQSSNGLAMSGDKAEISEAGNVTMDFKDADVNNVLRILSYKSGVNIVAGKDVEGLVTIRLVDVPWEQALDVILRTYGYAYEKEGNIIRVTTIENLKQEELVTQVFNLNYAKASEVSESINEVLTERGRIKFDERTNLLIVTDLPTNIHKIGAVIASLDRRTPQISIEAKIIETTLDDTEKLGIDWNVQGGLTAGGIRPTTFPFPQRADALSQFYPEGRAVTASEYVAMPNSDTETYQKETLGDFQKGREHNFPIATTTDFTFGTLDFSSFQMVLKMLDNRSDTEVLSNPRIVTLNNKTADILVGQLIGIPMFERNSNTGQLEVSGYEERSVGIKLQVTPHVNAQGEIVVDVHPEVSALMEFEELTPELKAPKFSTREATTQVMVRDGETIVVGGLISETKVTVVNKVPLLGNIPLLGRLFRYDEDGIDKTDLLIFITVRLVDGGSATEDEALTVAQKK